MATERSIVERIAALHALGRPVFVIYRLHEDDMIDAPERFEYDRRFRGRFATREIAVWEVLPDE